jgi:hypothetical protein
MLAMTPPRVQQHSEDHEEQDPSGVIAPDLLKGVGGSLSGIDNCPQGRADRDGGAQEDEDIYGRADLDFQKPRCYPTF